MSASLPEPPSVPRPAASVDESYGPDRHIAISGGQVIADAASFAELRRLLQTKGKDPVEVLIVQAGVDYSETAMIF